MNSYLKRQSGGVFVRNYCIALLLGLILTLSMLFSGCSSIKNVFNQTTNVSTELEEKGGVRVVLTPQNIKEDNLSKEQYEVAMEIMNYRLKSMGCDKESITIDDAGNIVVEIVYNAKVTDTNFQHTMESASKPGLFTIQEVDESKKDNDGTYLPTDKVIVNSNDVKDAKAMDEKDKGINILVELTDKASKNFEEATGRLCGKPLGIFIDNQLISAPVVKEKITGGRLTITGQENMEQALNLITIIKSGPLPFKLDSTSIQSIPANKSK